MSDINVNNTMKSLDLDNLKLDDGSTYNCGVALARFVSNQNNTPISAEDQVGSDI